MKKDNKAKKIAGKARKLTTNTGKKSSSPSTSNKEKKGKGKISRDGIGNSSAKSFFRQSFSNLKKVLAGNSTIKRKKKNSEETNRSDSSLSLNEITVVKKHSEDEEKNNKEREESDKFVEESFHQMIRRKSSTDEIDIWKLSPNDSAGKSEEEAKQELQNNITSKDKEPSKTSERPIPPINSDI